MVTKIKPQRIEANNSPQVGYVPKYVDEQTFEWGAGSGTGTGIVPAFNVPYSDGTYTALQTINAGEHVSAQLYTGEVVPGIGDSIKNYPSGSTVNYGQTFERTLQSKLTTITSTIYGKCEYPSNSQENYSLTAKIYAITGTYGVDAVKTGPALYTSDTINGNFYNAFSGGNAVITYTFNTLLPVGQYIVMIEGSTSHSYSGSGHIEFLGDSTPSYGGNSVDDVTPIAGETMNLTLNSDGSLTAHTTVGLASAATDALSNRIGVATESKLIGEDILIQKTGEVSQVGAVNDRALRYLSDTPGDISTTPGTKVRVIAEGSDTDKVRMGRDNYDASISISNGIIYYTNTAGIVWFTNTRDNEAGGGIETSLDNVTWTALVSWAGGGVSGDPHTVTLQGIIPASVYFRAYCGGGNSVTWSGTFRPIK